MPTLIIENVSQLLFERINQLAQIRRQKPADAVVDVLEAALAPTNAPVKRERLPQEHFLTEEICSPTSIPRPTGERVVPVEIVDYLPNPHDIPASE